MLSDTEIADIIKNVFITLRLKEITDEKLAIIDKYRLNLEIGIDHYCLDMIPRKEIEGYADFFNRLGLLMTVHAPFNELFPGSPDRFIREASIKRLDLAFEVIPLFNPKSVLLYLNFEEKRFRFVYDTWITEIIPNLARYAEKCASIGSVLCLENVYEETPDAMVDVLNRLEGCCVGFYCDVGHVSAFSEMMLADWLDV